MRKILLVVVIIVLSVASVLYILLTPKKQKSNDKGRVEIYVNKIDSRYSITSDKDGLLGTYFGENNTVDLSYGKHNLTVDAEGYDNYSAQLDVVGRDQSIKIDIKKKSALSNSIELINDRSTKILKAEYFADDTWMITFLQHDTPFADSDIIVSKKIGDKWRQVSQGSAIDLDYLKYEGAPSDLIKYLGGL